jgi:hypothetical protein
MSEHENAFDQFVSTIQEDLLTHKKVFYLNHLLEEFVPFLTQLFWWNCVVFVDSVIGNIIQQPT